MEKKNILIVEDSIDFSNLMKFIIEDMGYEGVQFPLNDGDIINWATDTKPAVILMDLALKRKEGMDYVQELKENSTTKHIPIVIITGRELGSKDVLQLEIQDIKYLRKGRVEMDEIRKTIKEAAESGTPHK